MYDRDQLTQLPAQIAELLDKTLAQLALLQTHAANLVELGIVDASTYYRGGIYLYLVHPTQPDGNRQREYIGKDVGKVAAALARLERYQQYNSVTQEINRLEDRLGAIGYSLESIKRQLERF
jgi:hypothetical protein